MCSWKSVIKQCNSDLQQLLNLNCLTAALYAEGLLTDQEQQELANESSVPFKQNSHFIQKILPFKGEQSFKKFLRVLENDAQHCGHKELFDNLARCYARVHIPYTFGNEDDSEHIDLTKRQLKLVLGELIKESVRDQIKEVLTLQKKHEEQEANRHKKLINLLNSFLNQQRNNSGVDTEGDQRRISTISNTTSFTTCSSAVGSSYSADCEESDTLSIYSGEYPGLVEDVKPTTSILGSPDDEQLLFPEYTAGRPRAKSLTSSSRVREHRSASRSYSSINVNTGDNELLKPPSNARVLHQEQAHTHSSPRKAHTGRSKENQSLRKRGPSSLTQECMTSTSRKISREENILSINSPESISAVTSTTTHPADPCNASVTSCNHQLSEEADSPLGDTIATVPSIVTLHIQSASDDNGDDDGIDKEGPDTTVIDGIDKGSSDTSCVMATPSSSLAGDPNTSKLDVPSVHPPNQKETSDILNDSSVKEEMTCQFTIGDPAKQQQVYCQEKDGIVYFISWMDKQVRCRRISRLGAQHDMVITYDPSTNTLSPNQFICRRANMSYAFGILNYKNRIVLVAGDNPKFLDGSVFLYQLVECKKYQRAFSYKWNEMAKSVRSCSPVVASPTHAVCTATDDCIMVCQLTNNSDCTLKALSINIYNEASTEEDTKWKVVSLNLPATLLHENGHLTSGTVHENRLYLSIKTSQGFGVMQVSVTNLERSADLLDNSVAFYSIIDEMSVVHYSLFTCCDKLLASSVSKHTLSSCSIGLAKLADSSIQQASSSVHQVPVESAQLHSIISVPKCTMLILVYYVPHLQSYVLNSVRSVL